MRVGWRRKRLECPKDGSQQQRPAHIINQRKEQKEATGNRPEEEHKAFGLALPDQHHAKSGENRAKVGLCRIKRQLIGGCTQAAQHHWDKLDTGSRENPIGNRAIQLNQHVFANVGR